MNNDNDAQRAQSGTNGRSAVHLRASRYSRTHLGGFTAGLACYALVAWLPTGDTTRLVAWAFVTTGTAWWYTVNGGTWRDPRRSIARTLTEGTLLIALALALGAVVSLLLQNPTAHTVSHLPSMSLAQVVYRLAAIPLLEEVLFRGSLYEALRGRSVLTAVLGSALAFSAAHGISHHDPLYALSILPAGLILGALRALSGGIWAPSVLHVAVNALAT